MQGGLNLLAPLRNLTTKLCSPINWLATGAGRGGAKLQKWLAFGRQEAWLDFRLRYRLGLDWC